MAEPATEAKEYQSRFYEKEFPDVGDLVMVNVRRITDTGAYVSLLEYNEIEGMIMLSELSRRRIRSMNRLIRVGKNEVVMVQRVDREKGYIDLSKRQASPEDIHKCEETYNKSKSVHSILRRSAMELGVPLEEIYTKVGWPLYTKFAHALDAFRLAISDQSFAFGSLEGIPDEWVVKIMEHVKRRLAPQPIKIRADVEVTCFSYEGIDAIKAALLAGEGASTEEIKVEIKLIAPPRYVVLTATLDTPRGILALQDAIEKIKTCIESFGGNLEVKTPSTTDEKELGKMLKKLELENQEVDGDDADTSSLGVDTTPAE